MSRTTTADPSLIPDIEAFEELVAIHIHEGGIPTDEAKDLALLQLEINAMHDLDLVGFGIWWINRRADLETAYFEEWVAHYPRPPLREVVLLRIQSATRFTEIASVAIAKAGTNAAGMP